MTRPLTRWERVQLRWHNFICPPCHKMETQFGVIRTAIDRIVREPALKTRLSPEAKERLRNKIEEAAKDIDAPPGPPPASP